MAQERPSKIRRVLKVSRLRLITQVASLVVIFSALSGAIGLLATNILSNGLVVPVYACYYSNGGAANGRIVTCFIWSMQTAIFPFFNPTSIAIILGVFVAMIILVGRLWCGWICPMGLVEDLETRFRNQVLRWKHGKMSERLNQNLSQLRYIILAVILVVSFIVGAEFFLTSFGRTVSDQYSVPFCQVCPIKPLFTFFETTFGLMAKSNTYGIYGIGVWTGMYMTALNIFVLTLFLIAAFAIRRIWCRFCPAGGAMGLLNKVWFLRINKEETRCTKCGICKRVCPLGVTEVYENKGGDVTSTNCMLCLRCVEMCPYEDTLKTNFLGKTIYKSKDWLKGKFS